MPVPADCRDGFGGCYWNRPEAYLDPIVQEGMSSFAQLDPEVAPTRAPSGCGAIWSPARGTNATATCARMTEIDIGYRLLVAGHLS